MVIGPESPITQRAALLRTSEAPCGRMSWTTRGPSSPAGSSW
jgi:hypothetical protein